VTQEERWFGQLASLRQPPEQVRGDNRLACACGERQQHPGCRASLAVQNDLLEGGADRRILIVAALSPCRAVRLEQHGCVGGVEVYPTVLGITCRQVGVRGEIGKLKWPSLQACEAVVLPVAVAIGREN